MSPSTRPPYTYMHRKKTATHRIYNLDSSFLQSTIHYSVKQTKTVRVGAQVTSRVTYAEPRVGTADESGV